MTVVELNEWIPSEQFTLKRDNVTDGHIGVVYAKFPSSALGNNHSTQGAIDPSAPALVGGIASDCAHFVLACSNCRNA